MKIIYLLVVVCLVLFSCNETTNSNRGRKAILQNRNDNDYRKFVVGSWKDTTDAHLHFTLFEDGSARSDNMETLLYRKWKLNGNKITFTIESVGNETSFVGEETFTIDELTKEKMVLKKGSMVSMIMIK